MSFSKLSSMSPAPLECVGSLQHREPVQGAAHGTDGMDHVVIADPVAAQDRRYQLNDPAAAFSSGSSSPVNLAPTVAV
ncbi:MAG TPA: hypothetical protein VF979_03595 [Streptosporangiaceae bacterium]